MAKLPQEYVSRQAEIVARFHQALHTHLEDFLAGRVEQLHTLTELASVLCLHPGHLSQVIKAATGHHACHFYEQRLVVEAKKRLKDTSLPIGTIARQLDYEVSNFTKFFKRFTGLTPSQYRKTITTSAEDNQVGCPN
ncbi:helix-turn-helix transcriptional regulator [Hymenobacter sp. UYP22]|uniref:helix-turn-helix domain-containing protein n=1 Tax=Hymenobacter sp. UYP22 TaxID=3156348 RepID=UPI003396B72D